MLEDNEKRISYRIYHLDHQWKKSNISSIEYYDGFENNQLDFLEPSFNTFVNYRQYRLSIPKESFTLTKIVYYAVDTNDYSLRKTYEEAEEETFSGKVSKFVTATSLRFTHPLDKYVYPRFGL